MINSFWTWPTELQQDFIYWITTQELALQLQLEVQQKTIVGYFEACECEEVWIYTQPHPYHLVCAECVESIDPPCTPDNYGWEVVTHADYKSGEYIYCDGLCRDCGKRLVE